MKNTIKSNTCATLIVIILIILGLNFLLTQIAYSQELECGFQHTEKDLQIMKKMKTYALNSNQDFGITSVPVAIYAFGNDDGSNSISESSILSEISLANQYYANAGINFFLCKPIEFINDTELNYSDSDDQSFITNTYNTQNVINIYTVNALFSSNGSSLCGYAYFPGGPNTVFMAHSCFTNGSTLVHELGHFFGLFHTHGTSNQFNSTSELADGSNGDTAGDYIVDTPSDPRLSSSNVNSFCEYTGDYLDNNGQPHQPNPRNIMSYSRKVCRDLLTDGQYDVINAALNGPRSNLLCEGYSFNFSANETNFCEAPATVLFTAEGDGEDYDWDFNDDGVVDFTGDEVEYTYFEPGNYTVSVSTVINDEVVYVSKDDYIQVGNESFNDSGVKITIMTDNWPSEIDWQIIDSYNQVYASGGDYEEGEDDQKLFEYEFYLNPGCYEFVITDVYGDGICCTSGQGYYKIETLDGILIGEGGDYDSEDRVAFKIDQALSLSNLEETNLFVYPNPTKNVLNLKLNNNKMIAKVRVFDMQGKEVINFEYEEKDSTQYLDTSKLEKGVYILQVHPADDLNTLVLQKIIIE